MKTLGFALLGAVVAAPAAAQSVQFNAVAQTEVGYATNPFLASGVTEGSIFASASIAPRLLYQTARSSTVLSGKYSREIYGNGFGYTDSGTASLLRTDQLTPHLGSSLTASFTTSNRATITDPEAIDDTDPLNVGRRTKTLAGSYELQWQATAHDQISYGGNISHLSYGNLAGQQNAIGVASDYTQYGVNASYNHIVDARTTVGAQVTLSTVRSQIYPDSRSIQAALTAKRQLTAIWTLDGHVGMVFSHIEGPFARSSKSLSLGLDLCGTYPRMRLCLKVSRDTTPSGYGSLRTLSTIDATMSYDIDQHSHITANASYRSSSSGAFTPDPALGNVLPRVPQRAKTFMESVDYDRDITRRISAGFGGQYEQRVLSNFPAGRSYTVSAHLRAKLGRM